MERITKSEWVEKEVAEKEKKMPLDAHNRNTLRAILSREFNEEEKSNRDYVYGHDEGEELEAREY